MGLILQIAQADVFAKAMASSVALSFGVPWLALFIEVAINLTYEDFLDRACKYFTEPNTDSRDVSKGDMMRPEPGQSMCFYIM